MTSSRLLPTVRELRTVGDIAQEFDLELIGNPDVEVDGVVADNRRARDGDLFVALAGARVHGILFAESALASGARAILTDAAGAEQFLDAAHTEVPLLVTADVRATVGHVAALIYSRPAERMTTFGLTGTNGKTTSSFMLDHILARSGRRTGLIGTVATRYGETVVSSSLTTPEAPELQEWFAVMAEAGVDALTMEVSSHSIAMNRVGGVVFDVVGFTNLSQDHLDFHSDLTTYFETKAELFTAEYARRGVIVVDDEWGQRLAYGAQIPATTVTTRADIDADWTLKVQTSAAGRTEFTLGHRDGRRLTTSIDLPGQFNLANAALALVMAVESGLSPREIEAALGSDGIAAEVPGRMEVVATHPRVVVDFAHNADALALALDALRPTTPGRLFVVFGATGERDTGKRPVMGRVAAEHADVVVVTDDDPHGEDPAQIRTEVLAGTRDALASDDLLQHVAVLEIAPRAEAIRQAILVAHPEDTVLVAGRGHETVQEVAGVDIDLDDRVEARAAVAARLA